MNTAGRQSTVRACLAIALVSLIGSSACSLWPWKKHAAVPNPTEIIVNGAPVDSLVFVDGSQAGQPVERGQRSQILEVSPGAHKVEIHVGDSVAYREDTYVAPGERRIVTVLSGTFR